MPQTPLPEFPESMPRSGVHPIPAPIAQSIDQLLETISRHQQAAARESTFSTSALDSDSATHGDALKEKFQHDGDSHVAQHLAALIDIVNRLNDGNQESTASRQLVGDLASHLSAMTLVNVTVSLASVDEVTSRCRIIAASDVTHVAEQSEQVIARQSAAQEALARDAIGCWPCSDASKRYALLAHEQLTIADDAQVCVSAPLALTDGGHPAVVVCTASWKPTKTDTDAEAIARKIARFLHAAGPPLAAALRIRNQLDRPWWKRLAIRTRRIISNRRYQLVGAFAAVCGAAMFLPMDYKVACQVELQPVSRRFVAAPFAAQLQKCLVEPGDVVESGQLLAVLDGREIQWELSGVLSDLEKAKKERNAHLSERSAGLAAIARHEAQRMQNKASLLQARLEQLEIRSPIAGVIVAGDLKDTIGAPLETGESLFEVAPLDRMKVHVGIPEDDFRHVLPNMTAALQLDAMPSEAMQTKLQTIRPMAEIFEDDNVFIAEAELDNDSGRFRPGMRGQAKVSTGRKPLGWNLFHKPVAWLVGWLGW